jgi:hypothetical protein
MGYDDKLLYKNCGKMLLTWKKIIRPQELREGEECVITFIANQPQG